MNGMLMALALWFLLKALDRRVDNTPKPCQHCFDQVHWDGKQYVHPDGQVRAVDEPSLYIEAFDTEPISHPATPV